MLLWERKPEKLGVKSFILEVRITNNKFKEIKWMERIKNKSKNEWRENKI